MTIQRAQYFGSGGFSLDFPTRTEHLTLTRVTQSLAEAETNDTAQFSSMLSAKKPRNWPPEIVLAPDSHEGGDWVNFYLALADDHGGAPELIGIAGMKQWPAATKTVQVGAALLPEYHGRRFGQEVVATLGKWALSQPGIDQAICDVPEDAASRKSLERGGFVLSPVSPSAGFVRFQLTSKSQ